MSGNKSYRSDSKAGGNGLRPLPKPVNTLKTSNPAEKYYNNKPSPPTRSQSSGVKPRRSRRRNKNIVQRILNDLHDVLFGFSKRTNKLNITRLVVIIAAAAIICGGLTLTVWALTNKNAYEVFVGDKSIGFIAFKKEITKDELMNTAVKKLTESLNTNVRVNEAVVINRIHKSKKDLITVDSMIGEIYKSFTYTQEACAILVDGVEMAVLNSQAEADEILTSIKNKFISEDINIVESGFEENVETQPKFVEKDEITSKERTLSILTSYKELEQSYTIKQGDTLYRIAQNHGITMEEIKRLNPGVDENTVLRIGRDLVIMVPKPLLSIRTVEEVVYTDVKPKEVETRENANEHVTWTNVVQHGKDGQREVTAHIVRINGIQVGDKQEVSEKITVPPVTEIVEVGTKQTPSRR